ncbi:PP2C family protein-serine/threonine phosphatase [Streptomyces mangrovisoli]|uniref:Phosphatase n=1 Tax=Streptomyces mangrovisoli TaxID=1428628 RepID=A0A1J4P102_9ACTN|nr:PP2C family protein-serine/threonine phosphatase [Streptomyces mangrovisoli]OIJ68283.1 phosphatase [Streptomyces mangrovisoli]
MTPPEVREVTSVCEAARARIFAAHLTSALGAPAVDRARFLTALTEGLREHLGRGGARLTLDIRPPASDGTVLLHAVSTPLVQGPHSPPPQELAISCPGAVPAHPPRTHSTDDALHAEAVLAADEESAAVLRQLDETERQLRLHREELYQTNQDVLALHAELDTAARTQRDLLDAERAARGQAEKARRLLTFLGDASNAVSASLDQEDILRCLPELLVPDYASHVDVWLFDEPADSHDARSAAAVAAARRERPQHAGPRPGGLPGVDDLPPSALSPDRPLLCLPLAVRHTSGVLSLTAPGDRFDEDTTVMLVELAHRTAIALDNARRYEQHRTTAEALQRALLTDLIPTDGIHLAARYLPATRGLNIGGDWYDAFQQPDGSLMTVVGDVTGHGLRAAVIMGQLRTALRAYAVEDGSPAHILTRLHRMLRHQQPNLYATAVIARFRPGDPQVVWAAAGHPPAMVRSPDGTVSVLDTRPGLMLGVPLPFEYRNHTADLPPGSTLALYTDGLVERRSQGIDPGIKLLGHGLAALSTADLEDLDGCAETLLKPLVHDSERDDDVCLLLCRTLPSADRRAQRDAAPAAHPGSGGEPPRPDLDDALPCPDPGGTLPRPDPDDTLPHLDSGGALPRPREEAAQG